VAVEKEIIKQCCMKKYLLIRKPVAGIYQVDIDLYDSEEEARNDSLMDEDDILKVIPIEF
jgi:hypothetical protein